MDVIMDFEKAHETDIFSLCMNEFQKHFKRASNLCVKVEVGSTVSKVNVQSLDEHESLAVELSVLKTCFFDLK